MNESVEVASVICEEVFDENSVPSEEEVLEYAAKIGIDPKSEPHLVPIAKNGLMQPLPPDWKPCFDSKLEKFYYYNTGTKRSQWEHPLDEYYRQVVRRGRSEGYSSAGDDDSKTTAKEDLKSFEEASDILSSRSVDTKPEFPTMSGAAGGGGGSLRGSGPAGGGGPPLLLRRKQLQTGQDPLHVAKLINSTLRQSLPGEEKSRAGGGGPMPVLRRSQTSDVLSTGSLTAGGVVSLGGHQQGTPTSHHHQPPIRGILRESSFSGSVSSAAAASAAPLRTASVRFNQTPESGGGGGRTPSDGEERRSVRFAADTTSSSDRRQPLDIRFQLSHESDDETYSDVDDSTSSPEGDKGLDEGERGGEVGGPKRNFLSPVGTPLSPMDGEFPRTRKFTVTPVKESSLGLPGAHHLKGLFKSESVEPLDSDSEEVSLGGGKEDERRGLEEAEVRRELAHSPPTREHHFRRSEDGDFNASHPALRRTSSPSVGLLKRVPALDNIHALELTPPPAAGELAPGGGGTLLLGGGNSGTDLTEFASALSLLSGADGGGNSEERGKDEEVWERKKFNVEFQGKKEELQDELHKKLSDFKDHLLQEEEEEKKKLRKEFEENIAKLKEKLEAEYLEQEKQLRELLSKQLDELRRAAEESRQSEVARLRADSTRVLEETKADCERAELSERQRLEAESAENIQRLELEFQNKIEELKTENELKISQMKTSQELEISERKQKFEDELKELKQRHQNEVKELEESHKSILEASRQRKEAELARLEGDWEDRLTASGAGFKTRLETAAREADLRLARLRADWEQREEAELRRRRAAAAASSSDQPPLSVDFEKLRCEKRLLEDKYRSLKEKYLQLKKDVKIAVEKKLQAKTRRKLAEEYEEEGENGGVRVTKEGGTSTLSPPPPQTGGGGARSHHLLPPPKIQLQVEAASPRDLTDLSSEDQPPPPLLLTRPRHHSDERGRKGRSHHRSKEPRESELRSPPVVEEISGDIYLRHPLSSLGLSRSSENEFYRGGGSWEGGDSGGDTARSSTVPCPRDTQHRARPRDHLVPPSSSSENNNIPAVNQERELNELEVSLNRTQALFGEKMVRLRLLGLTLARLADDSASPLHQPPPVSPSNTRSEPMSPSSILQNLDNINAEIREIWNQLNKNPSGEVRGGVSPAADGGGGGGGGGGGCLLKSEEKQKRSPSSQHHRPSKRSEIEARLQGLRDWLQKPPPVDWAQLTL